ncbi:MAG: CAP domain-containing protein [Chloroflexi bacterium]|nr:CAP domain-containing protein [Chloroflexota bacterium]
MHSRRSLGRRMGVYLLVGIFLISASVEAGLVSALGQGSESMLAQLQGSTRTPTPNEDQSEQTDTAPRFTAAYDDPDVMAMLTELNSWRIEMGLWPLHPNETLTELAVQQAEYVLSLPSIPFGGEIHIGASGEYPGQRAVAEPYLWPTYGRQDRVAIGEIAYIGANEQVAIGYWRGSSIHNSTISSTGYREVGIAALPHPYGHIYIVVFGSRPDVLPVLVEPLEGQMYLSTERYRYSDNHEVMHDVVEYQILPAAEAEPDADAWEPWSVRVDDVPTFTEEFYVALTDGERVVVTTVDPSVDVAWLPENLDLASAEEGSDAEATATAAAQITVTPSVTPTRDPDLPTALPTLTPLPSATPSPTATSTPPPTATPSSTPTISPTPQVDALLIIYNSRSLAIVNRTSANIDLTPYRLVAGDQQLPLTDWDTEFATAPMSDLPAGDCVQVWSWREPGVLSQPDECRYRRSVIFINPDQRFWAAGDFEVYRNQELITVCSAEAGRCEVIAD